MIGLNQTATVQRATTTQDEYGVPVETWTDVGTVRCRLIPLPYSEQAELKVLGGGQHTVASHKVLMPIYDIKIKDRLVIGTETYTVLSVEDVDRIGHHIEAQVAYVEGV